MKLNLAVAAAVGDLEEETADTAAVEVEAVADMAAAKEAMEVDAVKVDMATREDMEVVGTEADAVREDMEVVDLVTREVAVPAKKTRGFRVRV